MYDLQELMNILYVDVETVSNQPDLASLEKTDPAMAALWRDRCIYLRRRFVDTAGMTDELLYQEKAGLQAEFAKIVCISVGLIKTDGSVQVLSYASDDERDLMAKFLLLVKNYFKSAGAGGTICGHNIKRFDIPMICKRACILHVDLPDPLNRIHKLKPWEMPFQDTAEVWSFGTWQESFASLDLLAKSLGVQSSKGDLDGSLVQSTYWEKKNLAMIKYYCENDVIVVMNVLKTLGGMPTISFDEVSRHDAINIK